MTTDGYCLAHRFRKPLTPAAFTAPRDYESRRSPGRRRGLGLSKKMGTAPKTALQASLSFI
jgi:hypothetical protein